MAPHPPAWYRDPKDPASVRRWDGRAWTNEVRPLPDWLRTLQLSPGPGRVPQRRLPAAGVRGSSRRLWLISAAMLLLGGVLMAVLGGSADDESEADRLGDRAFTSAADARCATTGASLGTATRHALVGDAEVARIQRIASAWEATAADLRALPVAPADARRVEQWLRTWDRWVTLGFDYADALDAGNGTDARAVLDEAAAPKAELTRFAVTNGMDNCAFR